MTRVRRVYLPRTMTAWTKLYVLQLDFSVLSPLWWQMTVCLWLFAISDLFSFVQNTVVQKSSYLISHIVANPGSIIWINQLCCRSHSIAYKAWKSCSAVGGVSDFATSRPNLLPWILLISCRFHAATCSCCAHALSNGENHNLRPLTVGYNFSKLF